MLARFHPALGVDSILGVTDWSLRTKVGVRSFGVGRVEVLRLGRFDL